MGPADRAGPGLPILGSGVETMQSDTDVGRLIRAAREGEPGALDRLLKLYRNYLSYLARSGAGKALGAKADPSDIVQDTLLRAFQGFAGFRGETRRSCWRGCAKFWPARSRI